MSATFQSGKHSALSQQILNEISAAKIALLNPEKKVAYDAQLKKKLAPKKPVAAASARRAPAVEEFNFTPSEPARPKIAPRKKGGLAESVGDRGNCCWIAGCVIGIIVCGGFWRRFG